MAKTESDKGINKLTIVLMAIFTSLILGLTIFLILLPNFTKTEEINIPDISGMTIKEATIKLEELGFIVDEKTASEFSEEVPEGRVLETEPKIGTKKKVGTTIKLVISEGDKLVLIENYQNRDYNIIANELTNKGLIVKEQKKDMESIPNGKENYIAEQSIKPGEKVKLGTEIILYTPNFTTKFPDFTNGQWTQKKITEWCEKYGIKLTIQKQPTTEYEVGTVLYQSRPEGYEAKPGIQITVRITSKVGGL